MWAKYIRILLYLQAGGSLFRKVNFGYLGCYMRGKQTRFASNQQNPLILEPGKEAYEAIRQSVDKSFFPMKAPIVLELGAGRGEYSTALAERSPGTHFIGVDVKGDRLWHGAKIAAEKSLKNVLFLRTRIEQLREFFLDHSISQIWITFPGPRPKNGEANLRLTNQKFLDIYKSVLTPEGVVHVKTDSDFVYSYTLSELRKRTDVQILHETNDLYAGTVDDILSIKTHFERKFLQQNKPIKYIKFRFIAHNPSFLTGGRFSSIITSLLRLFK